MIALTAICLLSLIGKSWCICPHTESGLQMWSDADTWNGNKPEALDSVTINKPILLDESPPELTKIFVAESGKLVISPDDGPIVLKLRHILVHGELHIGSEDCPYEEKFRIVLTGMRNDNNGAYKVPGFGEKFIGVENQGVLQIHGKRKLSWTKIEGTVSPPSYYLNAREVEQDEKTRWVKGLSLYIANINADGQPVAVSHETFLLQDDEHPDWVSWERGQMIQRLQGLQDGQIVMIAVQRGFEAVDHPTLLDALETTIFGEVNNILKLRDVNNEAFAMIFKKGDSSLLAEKTVEYTERNIQYARANLQVDGLQFSAQSLLNFHNEWLFLTNFLATDLDKGTPIITLVDDASSWQPGDIVVFTSTDFDMNQAELVKIANCERPTECSNNQIKLENELAYTHFGKIVNNVDMRGEVGLLTRNIVVEAEMQSTCPAVNENCLETENLDTFGGHIKINENFRSVNIEGVELHNMGQQTDLGSYPFHFHMCNETEDRQPYLRSNSINFAFIRCITVHGTHHLKVLDNMCYDTFGHGYFLEDGGEKHTVFDGNLGANIRRGGFLTTDKTQPSIFWLTNPLVTFENNVAAGTDGTGIWYVFPQSPLGPSADMGFMAPGEAMHTPMTKFENNVAHSCGQRGFNVEGILLDTEGNVDGHIEYSPKEDPLNPDSAPVEVLLSRFTGYKNYRHNAWIRGSSFRAEKFSLSDSGSGLTMPNHKRTRHFITDSVIVGRSENPTVLTPHVQRSNWFMSNKNRLMGLRFYIGNTYVNGVWFDGFQNISSEEVAGAFSWEPQAAARDVNAVINIKFGFEDPDENRIWTWKPMEVGLNDSHSERMQTFRDMDGSVTGITGATVIRAQEFYVTDDCEYRPNWRMAVCPHWYSRIWVNTGPVDIYRSDKPAFPERTDETHKTFSAALLYDFYYTIQWVDRVPEIIDIFAKSISDGNGLVIGVCLPPGSTFTIQSAYPVMGDSNSGGWTAVNSIEEVRDGTGKYFHNTQTGAVYVRIFNDVSRDVFDFDKCPGDEENLFACPAVRLLVQSTDYTNTKCNNPSWMPFDGANRQLGGPYEAEGLSISTNSLPASALPAEWGAGSTKPFSNVVPVDGQFSEWSEWTNCSEECGGGSRSRERACNSPPPSGGGNECVGDTMETEDCNMEACVPVNGRYGKWGKWSVCMCHSGSYGYRTRTRECNNPAPKHGGKHCIGAFAKTGACRAKNCE